MPVAVAVLLPSLLPARPALMPLPLPLLQAEASGRWPAAAKSAAQGLLQTHKIASFETSISSLYKALHLLNLCNRCPPLHHTTAMY